MNDPKAGVPPEAMQDPKTGRHSSMLSKKLPADTVQDDDGGEAVLSGRPREEEGVRDPQPKEIGTSDAKEGD